MDLLKSKNILSALNNIVHSDTQLHAKSIDLTVKSIHRFTESGKLDFGGSEFKKAETKPINPQKGKKDDDYGWWKLSAGTYKAVFNEQLTRTEDVLAIITLHNHAREAALLANTMLFSQEEALELIFQVPMYGCDIKENARIAAAYLFET